MQKMPSEDNILFVQQEAGYVPRLRLNFKALNNSRLVASSSMTRSVAAWDGLDEGLCTADAVNVKDGLDFLEIQDGLDSVRTRLTDDILSRS